MISDEIRERLTETRILLNPSAFILGIAPLLALYAIRRILRGEARVVAYADSAY